VSDRAREAIARVPLFSSLSPRYRKRLADLTEEQRFMAGASVVEEGEIGDTFYLILEGEAKVTDSTGRTVNRLYPGLFFGEVSLLDGGARTATVIAETPLTTLALRRKDFMRLLQQEPHVAVNLLSHVAGLLRRLQRSIAN
jgi:CRP-like cAMP-binding protein